MTTSPAQQPEDLRAFASQVRSALSDLPTSTLDELLEDLDEHLAEVAAEHDGALDTLGTPAAYAHELRRAAGLPPRATSTRISLRSLDAKIHDAVLRLSRHDAVRPVLAFLPELRPAWWVLRAWLALLALDYLVFGSQHLAFPLPGGSGLSAVLGLPLLAAAVVLSVRLGRRAAREPHTDPRRRRVSIAGNSLAALLAVIALVAVQQRSSQPVYADQGFYGPTPPSGMAHPDGTPITNIYPYSATGEPLSGVLLYDQDGRALDDLATSTLDGQEIQRVVPAGTPPPPANAYPQQQHVLDFDGNPLPPVTTPLPTTPVTPAPEPTSEGATGTPTAPTVPVPTAPVSSAPVPSALVPTTPGPASPTS